MAETASSVLPFLKRWAWLAAPIGGAIAATLTLVGFQLVPPNVRTANLEAQVAAVPGLIDSTVKVRLQPIDSVLGVVLEEQEAARARDAETRAFLERMSRAAAMGLLVNCTQLTAREREWARQLAQVCDETSQRTGIQYRPPPSP